MSRQIPYAFFAVGCLMMFSVGAAAQRSRPSVSAAEVTGTFSHRFGGKFKNSSSDIEISSIGKGRLFVAFELVYPFVDGSGEKSANTGEADGTATIKGDTAVYRSSEFGQCTITIKFVRPGTINVTQSGTENDCGFGHNVTADGVYQKTSSKKPKFRAADQARSTLKTDSCALAGDYTKLIDRPL